MPSALITGAAGFLGSHLVERYLKDGAQVVGIDNCVTGDLTNLKFAEGNSAFTFLSADISSDARGLFERVEANVSRCGLILHFASPASPVDYDRFPIETMAVNSKGTEFCAQLAVRWGARLLYASTSESYGDPLVHPQPETYWGNVNPVGPRSCYDESKRFGEALAMAYIRSHAIDARIIRIFNTYGPRMRKNDGRVVPNFVAQALRKEALTIYGDGSQTRSFCYVEDLIEGIVRCAGSEQTRALVVNIGNPEEHTIREFAEIVCEVAGVTLRIESRPLPPDDPKRRTPDITRARTLLGWEPRIPLREGLRRTIDTMQLEG